MQQPTHRPTVESNDSYSVGKNSRGHWVAQNQAGLRGGLFATRLEALKFAKSASGFRRKAVVMVPGVFELKLIATRSSKRDPLG